MARKIFVVDDEQEVRSSIAAALGDEGYQVVTASDGISALDILRKENPDVVLLDVWMTGPKGERQQEGLDVLSKIKASDPEAVVIIMSGHGTIETAVRATKLGAFDFIEKPLSLEKLLVAVQNGLQIRDLSRENQSLRTRVTRSRALIGKSPLMAQLQGAIRRVGPTDSWILITGENGTGKELVANAVHSASSRYSKPFVEVNCAAIPEDLIESELFGHERGSFTGATQMRRGKFDLANGGTLFLDEIGDMSLKTQAKILRILQEQRFERVGGSETIEVDVRVIAATNKDLETAIKENRFREDLYYRLNVVRLRVPPLRDRQEDIAPIADHYFRELAGLDGAVKRLGADALELFSHYSWPGNVRELKNAVERLVIFSDNSEISADQVLRLIPEFESAEAKAASLSSSASFSLGASLKDAKSEFEKEFIMTKLRENDWNVSRTASVLGIERSHLHRKIKTLGIAGIDNG